MVRPQERIRTNSASPALILSAMPGHSSTSARAPAAVARCSNEEVTLYSRESLDFIKRVEAAERRDEMLAIMLRKPAKDRDIHVLASTFSYFVDGEDIANKPQSRVGGSGSQTHQMSPKIIESQTAGQNGARALSPTAYLSKCASVLLKRGSPQRQPCKGEEKDHLINLPEPSMPPNPAAGADREAAPNSWWRV